MKIRSIELENFKQYKNKQIIQFSTDENNITIIKGNNGEGKTTLFRAIIFCLFGELKLPQDTENDLDLVNILSLKHNQPLPVRAYVKTIIEENQKIYEIERSIESIMKNDQIITSENTDIEIKIIEKDGNINPNIIKNEEEAQKIINNLLNKDIKDFFFLMEKK
ncbi:AAA family ATPase [Oceanotoga sp. DSM 15011]|uniref:AAA family ATPase n=1 Tax=Oceanotoga sp. DSM 15011 TaxID=2984951 RepID=UPI0021F3F46D|nr:AAA family ATPase [Oceanotoga sp. DSM 15011]UYP01282.1 AAA family ATPase [Oceanotoga sp. DSM 15011]